ncbi:FixH family protein [Bacillus sp. EB01]|uniref:FixH family protein n=1 Tax=Bacillus sp. EB01 TaxID=1347086 RepID=UPI0005C663F0|nr:FixH family protein [Bacillus sp. EB01]
MKKLMVIMVGLLALVLSGCGSTQEKNDASNGAKKEPPKMVEVMFMVPEKLEQNKEAELKVHVTQGKENVDDANEVKFEITRQGQSTSEMIDAELQGDGIYSIKKTFTEAGKYEVVSHVTARDMHTMPKVVIDVAGDPAAKDSGDASSEHGHHGHGVQMEFSTGTLQAGKESTLKVSLVNDGKPLTDAAVRFEVWKDGAEKHYFIDAASATAAGTYESSHTFGEAGSYQVRIHVEKGDIHDHQDKKVTVK